jgi:hypothetical protein
MIVINDEEKDPFSLYVICVGILMIVVFVSQIIIKNN